MGAVRPVSGRAPYSPILAFTSPARALDGVRREFPGVCVWHGQASGSFWALLPDRLVEADTAEGLARRLRETLPRPRHQARPSMRRPDGSWTTHTPKSQGVLRLLPDALRRLLRIRDPLASPPTGMESSNTTPSNSGHISARMKP